MDFLCKKVIAFQYEQNILPRFLRHLPKIIKALPEGHNLVFHDIKQDPITEEQLDEMYQLSGSYEALFSKKAQLYKSLGLKDKALTETDFKKYLLEHYTFLSRPVFIINGAIYIGNSQQNILQVHNALR